ncbi:MAG: T9SS type A sorting domain-containing protein, partial [Bacteroidota bacterium]
GLEGSYNVQQEAESKGVCAFLHTMEGEDHPSGSASEAYFDEIFNRAMPRLGALVRGQTYCCSLDVELTPTGVIQTDANTPLNLNATVSDDQGNAVVHWCEAPCGVYHVGSDFPFAASALPEHVLAIVTEGNCMNTDFVGVEALPVGAEEVVALESSIEVFPVPTAADVTLRGLKTVMRAKLFDTKGRLCRDFGQVREGTVLDMRDLPAGIYGLQLEGKMGTVAKKLVVRYDATR